MSGLQAFLSSKFNKQSSTRNVAFIIYGLFIQIVQFIVRL